MDPSEKQTPRSMPALAEPADQSSPIAVPKHIKRWMPLAKSVGVPVLTALTSISIAYLNSRGVKDQAVEESVEKSAKVTKSGYLTLRKTGIESTAKDAEQDKAITKITDTLDLHTKLLLASNPAPPPPSAAVPATPAGKKRKKRAELVRLVQDNADKTLKEIKPTPPPAPPPETIPAQPPAQPLPQPPQAPRPDAKAP